MLNVKTDKEQQHAHAFVVILETHMWLADLNVRQTLSALQTKLAKIRNVLIPALVFVE